MFTHLCIFHGHFVNQGNVNSACCLEVWSRRLIGRKIIIMYKTWHLKNQEHVLQHFNIYWILLVVKASALLLTTKTALSPHNDVKLANELHTFFTCFESSNYCISHLQRLQPLRMPGFPPLILSICDVQCRTAGWVLRNSAEQLVEVFTFIYLKSVPDAGNGPCIP